MVAAAVAGVAVIADPTERRPGAILPRLGPAGERGDVGPGAALGPVRDYVERQAERVLAPTLLVYGRRDQLVAYRMAGRAARAFRDSRLLTLPDAGHVAMMEYPHTVARAVQEFLVDRAHTDDTDEPGRTGVGS